MVGRSPHLRRCKESRVISREGGRGREGFSPPYHRRQVQAGHRMQVSNGKTIWPMFARQTATTSRGYLQRAEEREARRRREKRKGRRSLNSPLWAARRRLSKCWISEQSGAQERRRGGQQRRTRLRRGRPRRCFEICPSRDRRSFNLDKHHFRARNTHSAKARKTDRVNERVSE